MSEKDKKHAPPMATKIKLKYFKYLFLEMHVE